MAEVPLTFTIDNFCAANTHADLNALEDGVEIFDRRIYWADEKEPPSNEELKTAVYILARELIQRSGATTKAEVALVMSQISITLNHPVV